MRLLKVHVGIAQRPPGDHVPADSDRQHRAAGRELLKQHSLRHVGVQIADVQRRHGIIGSWVHSGRWFLLLQLHESSTTNLRKWRLLVFYLTNTTQLFRCRPLRFKLTFWYFMKIFRIFLVFFKVLYTCIKVICAQNMSLCVEKLKPRPDCLN